MLCCTYEQLSGRWEAGSSGCPAEAKGRLSTHTVQCAVALLEVLSTWELQSFSRAHPIMYGAPSVPSMAVLSIISTVADM